MEIEVAELPDLRMAAIRSDMSQMQAAWERFLAAARPWLFDRPAVRRVSVLPVAVLTDHAPATPHVYYAAALLPEEEPPPAGLLELHVPGGRYARATYVGPYEGLGEAWSEFAGQWLPASGERAGEGFCFEIYRNHLADGPSVELRTELHIPLA